MQLLAAHFLEVDSYKRLEKVKGDRPATMAVTTIHGEILPSLEKHNDAFTSLLSLIPAKYYIVQESTEDVRIRVTGWKAADRYRSRPTRNG